MAKAIKTSELGEWHAAKAAKIAQRDRYEKHALKTFEQLTDKEREHILKLVAVRLGMVADSPDE